MKPPDKPVNKAGEALKEPSNIVYLVGAAALCAVTLNPIVIGGAIVAEAAYLILAPRSKWFDARLSAKEDKEASKHREILKAKLFKVLGPDLQMRFTRLENLRSGIAKESFESKRWYREVVRKLDYLLEKFLLFGSKEGEFVNYLVSLRQELGVEPRNFVKSTRASGGDQETPTADWVKAVVSAVQGAYTAQIAEIEKARDAEQNPHNQAILDKRREVVDRRQQYIGQMGDILLNLGQQICLIEDTFGLINDEIRARSPEQVLADIDDVVNQTDNLAATLQKVQPFEAVSVEA